MFTSTVAILAMVTSPACCWCKPHYSPRYAPRPTYYYVVPQATMPAAPVAEKPKEKTLYDRLGGEAAIKAVIDDFVARAAANPKVNFTRKGTANEWKPTPEGIDHLKKMLVDLVGMVTGGPQKYTGRDMKSAHKGMKITQAEFDALAGDLKATLDKFKVPAKEQMELLKIVASTAADIVEEKK